MILEGLAASVPIIATDIPGNREILVHGQNSYLVSPTLPDELADAILKIYLDQSLRSTLVKNGLETVKLYGIKAIAQEHEYLYQHLFFSKA